MASLVALWLAAMFVAAVRCEANDTLPVMEPTVNISSTDEPVLPPGGLPEVILDPVEVINSTTPASAASLSPDNIEGPEIAAKQMKPGKESILKTPQVVDPDALPKKVLGSKCVDSKDCLSITNTNCINGICDCTSGFIPSKHSLEKCVKVPTGLGDACEEEAQCAVVVAASECSGGKCSCPPNFVFDMGRCWEKQLLGGVCNTSVQCEIVAFSLCAQSVCACQPPLIPSPDSYKCLKPAGTVYRAQCEEDIQCTDSYGDEAHCSNSLCICTNSYHFNGTTCVPDKKLGDTCMSDLDCAVSDIIHDEGSRTCASQVCACAEGFTSLNGEEICTLKSSGEELAVSFTWITCIVIAKYYLS